MKPFAQATTNWRINEVYGSNPSRSVPRPPSPVPVSLHYFVIMSSDDSCNQKPLPPSSQQNRNRRMRQKDQPFTSQALSRKPNPLDVDGLGTSHKSLSPTSKCGGDSLQPEVSTSLALTNGVPYQRRERDSESSRSGSGGRVHSTQNPLASDSKTKPAPAPDMEGCAKYVASVERLFVLNDTSPVIIPHRDLGIGAPSPAMIPLVNTRPRHPMRRRPRGEDVWRGRGDLAPDHHVLLLVSFRNECG